MGFQCKHMVIPTAPTLSPSFPPRISLVACLRTPPSIEPWIGLPTYPPHHQLPPHPCFTC